MNQVNEFLIADPEKFAFFSVVGIFWHEGHWRQFDIVVHDTGRKNRTVEKSNSFIMGKELGSN